VGTHIALIWTLSVLIASHWDPRRSAVRAHVEVTIRDTCGRCRLRAASCPTAAATEPRGDGWRRLPFRPGLGGVLFLVSGGLLALGDFGSLHPLAHEDLVMATCAGA
jgi:hypothetical protein